jgi:hypothetical protein
MKWLIFRSNLSGANQAYAVELKKTAEGRLKENFKNPGAIFY